MLLLGEPGYDGYVGFKGFKGAKGINLNAFKYSICDLINTKLIFY